MGCYAAAQRVSEWGWGSPFKGGAMQRASHVRGGLLVVGIAIQLAAPHLWANDVPSPYRFWINNKFTGPFATVGNGSSIVGYTGVDDEGNFTGAGAVSAVIDNL